MYRAMKMYPILKQALHHEGVWESSVVASGILNLGTRWRSVVNLTPRPCSGQNNILILNTSKRIIKYFIAEFLKLVLKQIQ
jgi:hypothetical protein